jgi:Flp pilus assembly protein TadD
MHSEKTDSTIAQILQVKPSHVAALIVTGHKLYQQGRLKDAANIFEGLVLIDNNNAYAHGILGSIYQKQGELDSAARHFSETLQRFPHHIHSLTNRGEIYLRLGQFQEAADDLIHAIELDPEKKHPAANRARLLVCLVQDAVQLIKEKGSSALEQEKKKVRKVS